MVISWTPNGNEKVIQIQFNNNPQKEWHVMSGQLSGTTFNFENIFYMPDETVNQLTDIQWKTNVDPTSQFTITFIMGDASTVTFTVG